MTVEAPPCCRVVESDPIDPETTSDVASAFKALGDPHRLTMLLLIARSGEAVCARDLEEHFSLSQPTISHHLKILALVGFLDREQRGKWAHWSIRRDRFAEMGISIEELAS
jgi:ArsR family transcriptional regulator